MKWYHRRQVIISKIMERTKVKDEHECWEWQGATSGNGRGGGYPRMSFSGRTVAVHIVVFTHFFGYVPANKHIDHVCRNRLCLNPNHLDIVTPRENQRRRAKAGAAL